MPLLAQAPRVRYSADGGQNFPARYERRLTRALPNRPTTIPTFNRAAGTGRMLLTDHDVSRARALGVADPVGRVAAEAAGVVAAVERCGGRSIVVLSPSGGRHTITLFDQDRPWTELYALACALARRFPTIDISPMSNAAGQVRPPGSPHKVRDGRLTGYMRLAMPLPEALDVAARPGGARVWERLHDELAVELGLYALTRAAVIPAPAPPGDASGVAVDEEGMPWLPRRGGRRAPRPDLAQRARTGDWSGYRSRSEYVLALLSSFAAASWAFAQVMGEAEHGIYGGLVALLEHRTACYRAYRLSGEASP
ncbi:MULTISPECIES: hypothetical protein [unclassified Nonomuraea]|uniref:hypothetical protein n=1 Tax=unclassified Nonomuraea TaxID=2593643 RepID=UPI0033D87D7A